MVLVAELSQSSSFMYLCRGCYFSYRTFFFHIAYGIMACFNSSVLFVSYCFCAFILMEPSLLKISYSRAAAVLYCAIALMYRCAALLFFIVWLLKCCSAKYGSSTIVFFIWFFYSMWLFYFLFEAAP